ncbi:hypothetical protein OAU13_00200 [bacterium]|nr:hypothetical protein [bacterium]
MADIIKFKAPEIALSTANTVSLASVVRLINSNTDTVSTITIANTGGTIASFTLGYAGTDESVIYVAKEPTDTVAASGGTVKAASVAYK